MREEYLADLKDRFPKSDPKHLASLSDDDLVMLAVIDDAMNGIQSKEEAVSFFLSDDALMFLDLLFGEDTTDKYGAAIEAYLSGGSRAELAAWYRATFGADAETAADFARSISDALDEESGTDEGSTPGKPAKPVSVSKPAKPAPAKPAKRVPSKAAEVAKAAPAAKPASTQGLAETGFDDFGAAGLGVLALLAGGLATVAARRVRY
ncbi:hypothetical protein DWB68_02640 [Galactobacter valiniphilus]|uniref:Uncharacterized protein n=1 Tax=Galactobacter valiniphilus TaxID=2676122 RepID=A0A399JDC9_9MICC|nr:hypothetical protein DWB68_02640 [Galactobacter valiniphilus]